MSSECCSSTPPQPFWQDTSIWEVRRPQYDQLPHRLLYWAILACLFISKPITPQTTLPVQMLLAILARPPNFDSVRNHDSPL